MPPKLKTWFGHAADQGVLVLGVAGEERDPRRERELDLLVLELEAVSLDRVRDPLAGQEGAVLLGVREQDLELVAEVAGHDVHVADVAQEEPCDLANDLLGGLGPVELTHELEAVDVDLEERQGPRVTEAALELGLELGGEEGVVEEVGQGIAEGLQRVAAALDEAGGGRPAQGPGGGGRRRRWEGARGGGVDA